jgi:transcriptional regulator with XRE-family HTH domain
MMKTTHWTEKSTKDFLFRIASDFVEQLEAKMESKGWTKAQLAKALGVTKGRVSQIINNPGNLSLDMIIRCARVLGMKVAIVAYDDGDERNERGPVNSEIFRICWENVGKPRDFWSLQEMAQSNRMIINPGLRSEPVWEYADTGLLNAGVPGSSVGWEYLKHAFCGPGLSGFPTAATNQIHWA